MEKRKSLFVFFLMTFTGFIASSVRAAGEITMTIVYDNTICKEGTKADWGFACLIQGTEKTILFDTGYIGQVLLWNIDSLKINLNSLDLIVISHNHPDHTGGLNSVLGRNSDLPVYIGHSFPKSFSQNITDKGARPVLVDEPVEICRNVFSTGDMSGEQALILDTDDGLVIITGCAHPGILNILKKTKEILNKDIYLVFGGFHLLDQSEAMINKIINEFKSLGVKKCGATHCTGDQAIAFFKDAYGEDYIPMGVGRVIQVSAGSVSFEKENIGQSLIPKQFRLEQNYPNPFNPSTTICYFIPVTSSVKVTVYDLLGREVAVLKDESESAGVYRVKFDASHLTNGLYVYQLVASDHVQSRKMMMLK